jgi:hypothetical protein
MSYRARLASLLPAATATATAVATLACTTPAPQGPSAQTASIAAARSEPAPRPAPTLDVRPRPQIVVQQPSEPLARRPIRVRTPTRDWKLELDPRTDHLTVRDATTGFVLYRVDDRWFAGVSADPDRGVMCAVVVEHQPVTDVTSPYWKSEIYAIGWDLAGARELWRQRLPDSTERGMLSYHQTLVLGDRCLVIGSDHRELSLGLANGAPDELAPSKARTTAIWTIGFVDLDPAAGVAVVRNAEGFKPAGTMVLGLDDATPRRDAATTDITPLAPIPDHREPVTHRSDTRSLATPGMIWYQNASGISVQRLDQFALPSPVLAHPLAAGSCTNVSADRMACVDKAHGTLALFDGTRLGSPTPLPPPCARHKDVYDAALATDGTLAIRCDADVFVGHAGTRLRKLRPLGLGELGHERLTWVPVDGAPRLLLADATAGVMLLDASGRERWRRREHPIAAQLGPRGTVVIQIGGTIVFADIATGAARATVDTPRGFHREAAILGDELRGPTGSEYLRLVPDGAGDGAGRERWSAILGFGSGGMAWGAHAIADDGLVISTGWLDGALVSDADGNVKTETRFVDGGVYVLGGDGTFACREAGCAHLRCTVDGESRPVDDPACAALRRDTWSLPEHVAQKR